MPRWRSSKTGWASSKRSSAERLGKPYAECPFVQYEWHVSAACGYAELGMMRECVAELDAIEPRMQTRPEVLHLRLQYWMQKKRWSQALRIAQKLCRVAPDRSTGFLHAGYCLHKVGKTAEAKATLIKGPVALLKEPIYYYNMGCYDALLGNIGDAKTNLKISFKMDASFRDLAKRDPDLKMLQGAI